MDTVKHVNRICLSAVRWLRQYWDQIFTCFLVLCLCCGFGWYLHRNITTEELLLRKQLVQTANGYLGCNETDSSHEKIIDFYNTYEPSPRGYQVTYEDNWCAAFGSAMALETGLTGIVPMECSCEQQINLFKEIGCWREDECYLPRPGDYIYYVWDEWRKGDCTAWADHVGIVADTFGPIIKVIEGNKDDMVDHRYIFLNDIRIRGYGLPDYLSLTQ